MIASKSGRSIVLALVVLLVGQVVVFQWWRHRPPPLIGPTLGEKLPEVTVVTPDGDTTTLDRFVAAKSCTIVALISTYCSFCQRMRYTWTTNFRRWRDSVGAPVGTIWISPNSDSAIAAFYDGFDNLDAIRLRAIVDDGPLWRRLGVYGTPTVYLLDRGGTLAYGIMGDDLPPANLARGHCS